MGNELRKRCKQLIILVIAMIVLNFLYLHHLYLKRKHTVKLATPPSTTHEPTTIEMRDQQELPLKEKSAFDTFGLANVTMMKIQPELRSQFNYTLMPWKVKKSSYHFSINNSESHWSLIVMVKSHAAHSGRRKLIRNTWGSFKYFNGVRMEVVFIVGNSDPKTEINLLEESKEHGDILQINLEEKYQKVECKTLAGMQWAGTHFPSHWMYSSADDDMVPLLHKVFDSIEKIIKTEFPKRNGKFSSPYDPNFIETLPISCTFFMFHMEKPLRETKWAVDEETYPLNEYPAFCHGGWYTMPLKLAFGIYNISRQHTLFRLDDVWITGMLRLSYFKHTKDKTFFDRSSKNAGILIDNVGAVKHLYQNDETIYRYWKDHEAKIIESANEYFRI